jgi:hypothetical protein
MKATEAKNNFGLFIETLMTDGAIVLMRNGRRIALCRTTEEELLQREKAQSQAGAWLERKLRQPPSPAAQTATAQELMELMGIGESEARELFPEKFAE